MANKTEKTERSENTVAKLESQSKGEKITDDGKKHKQGETIKIKAFGVVIETRF